jgi:hypothetical protein
MQQKINFQELRERNAKRQGEFQAESRERAERKASDIRRTIWPPPESTPPPETLQEADTVSEAPTPPPEQSVPVLTGIALQRWNDRADAKIAAAIDKHDEAVAEAFEKFKDGLFDLLADVINERFEIEMNDIIARVTELEVIQKASKADNQINKQLSGIRKQLNSLAVEIAKASGGIPTLKTRANDDA